MSDETTEKQRFFGKEWIVIALIFFIAFITGFFYTRARLEATGESPVVTESGDIHTGQEPAGRNGGVQ
ncbi:MAG TPA: hypothetical protein PLV45_09030 [bacterium]|nr:hypothetical protein [bacterium]